MIAGMTLSTKAVGKKMPNILQDSVEEMT